MLVGVTGVFTIAGIVVLALVGHQFSNPDDEFMLLPDPPIFAVLGVVFAVILTLLPIPLFAALMLLFVLAG